MFIGHFGAGLAAKKIDNKPSLGTMFLAAQFLDLLWPLLLMFGIEKVSIDPGNTAFTPLDFTYYPFTHSLAAALIWSVLFALVYYFFRKNKKSAFLLAALVFSHWIFDFITHRPDLPIYPGSEIMTGLGLWNSVLFTIIIEGGIFFVGGWFYMSSTTAKNKRGKHSFWGLMIFLSLIYIMNIVGPPPPGVQEIAFAGNSLWLIVAWGYWIDRNRQSI